MSFLKAFAVSFGEPAGIGPDIALLAYAEKAERCLPPFYIIGDFDCLYARSEALGLSIPLKKISAPREARTRSLEPEAEARRSSRAIHAADA